jgi:hypothetical protein
MGSQVKLPDAAKQEQVIRDLRHEASVRQAGYRDRALKLLPHVCASCKREFSGRRLRELTVHHKDHNYKNNPPDGSNWELLCLFCHDHEHEKYKLAAYHGGAVPEDDQPAPSIFSPFEKLDELLKSAAGPADAKPEPGATPAGGDATTGGEGDSTGARPGGSES